MTFIPAAKPIVGDEERAAVDRVLRSGHDRPGPGGRGVRGGVRRPSMTAGRALRRRQLRHLRPAPRACSPPASGRATRSSCRRSPSPRPPTRSRSPAPPRSSPTSSPTTSASTPTASAPRSPTAPRRSCRCTSTATRPTWTPRRRRRRARAAHLRGRRPGPPRHLEGPPGRHVRRLRDVQPLPDQEHDLRRGRHGLVRDRRDRPQRPAAAQPGHGAAVRQRGRRLQRPDDRHARRHRPGAAHQGGRLDRDPQRQRRLPRPAPRGRRGPAGRRGRDARLPPVHDPRGRRRARPHRHRAARGAPGRLRRLLPDPQPPAGLAARSSRPTSTCR